ncbi:Exonuclease RNase T and DNA polymerase III [Pseudopedobacter saltans DSM 12145]|uniref:Exonuclease RNase T and DNA polymerase III n=1 Tax=Pseudopedobacter saltans (strain ATCC 51119 / DSM 12145 / JCM 21818 / CCUG 39354 / LMG 10337 / NBRC 100064 / NCIMB 13643) TaxID=762903 RepID=F0S6N3_PSESL|nr:3'-5' exonuclease [Pseudopedobacter saltans]ADY51109.1 Exonuclease RNase T and DNA polymerase III [Pseudopedobacter saltans DSM 12145]
MAKQLDKILIVDLEATCWEDKVPTGMESDIIEIGACLLDIQSGEISDSRGILVKPERSELSKFCTSLTTITRQMLDEQAIPFKEACNILKKEYHSQSRAWASFGAYDQKQFQRQCGALGIGNPMGPSHINVKTLFALKKKLAHEQGMAGALALLDIPLEGTHHRGVDDARNIAKILRWILN